MMIKNRVMLRNIVRWTAVVVLGVATGQAGAGTFVKADVTTLLGPAFFVDDAASGGTDSTINQPGVGSYVRTFGGMLSANQGPATIIISGFGFATSSATASNDATSLTVSFTYLGADGAVGGGDDVFIGSASGTYAYSSNGEYGCVFDAPLSASLNITGQRFLVAVAPTNAGGNGSVLFKVGTIPYDGTTGAKLSVAGTVSGALPATPLRVNLAKYQTTTAATENGQYLAGFATDGVVGNSNSWRSDNVTTAHWAEVAFPVPVTVRSAHLYSGIDDGLVIPSFRVQYDSGTSWLDAPGSSISGNTSPEVNVIFTSSVTSNRFRLYSDVDGNIRVRELALFPPNPAAGTGVEQGFPIGTDVELNLAKKRPVVATAASGTNYAKLAVDGFVDSTSKWQTTLVGSNTLDIDLRVSTKIGSAHLYSGDGPVPPIPDFDLQYWTGSAWANIPGGSITGNTSAARVITFTTPPTTSMVRLVFNNPSVSAVRELCIFPANGGAGYPLGQDVLGTSPPTRAFEDYNDAFYTVQNRAASLPLSVNGASPVLNIATLDPALSQYQVLLNVGTESFRLRNRATGKCLAGAGVSKSVALPLVDEDYTAMPHQNWRFVSVDGTDFYLINEWSRLAADTQAGGIATGTPLLQQAINGSASQRWQIIFQTNYPKKGLAGYTASWSEFQGNWAYNWGRTTSVNLPTEVVFNPMQWGNSNWDIGSPQGPIEQFLSEWHREDKSMHLLGFNEPDGAGQANMTVDAAITSWPRLERMGMPLMSPVAINPGNTWITDFMTTAQSLGHRIDGLAAHSYPDPGSGSPDALVNSLQAMNTAWGRPVWLTEFSTVDWPRTSSWTEEDNYNWLAEFMWRAESLPWLRHYSLFIFSADATHPEPINPWDTGIPGNAGAPRSNALQSDGTTPTAFGELYFAWDCDANVRGDKAYFIHNKGERERLQNATGASGPSQRWIRDGGNTVQWVLRPSGTAGQWYIVSLRDGRRLRYTGGTLDFAPAHTTGAAVSWNWVEDQYGWFYIENPAAPAVNRRLKDNGGVFSMVSNTNTGDQIKWRFVVPYAPVETSAPNPPATLTAAAGDGQVALTWSATTSTDFSFYSVYRSTASGGPYTLVATNLAATGYTNTSLQNGTGYFYVVTATDRTGYESTLSTQSAATPVIATPPKSLGVSSSNGNVTISWPATHLGWLLEMQTDGLAENGWTTVPNSATTTSMSFLKPPAVKSTFFRLKHP
jgi:hypothetical protein